MTKSPSAASPPEAGVTPVHSVFSLASMALSLQEIERLRHAARERRWALIGVFSGAWIVLILAFVFGMENGMESLEIGHIVLLAGGSLVLYGMGLQGPANAYRQAFKDQVIGRLVAERYEGARYSADKGIGEAEFKSSGLYQQGVDRYHTEDLIEARVGETPFRMAEIHAEYRTSSGKSTRWHTVFKGRFIVARFSKRFHGRTLVLSEGWRPFGISGLEKAALEDTVFEKLFAVYSTDQVEARYLLSLSMMERLVAAKAKLDADVQAAFVNDHLILAIPDRHDRFEPPPFWSTAPLISEDDVQTYLADIGLAADLIGELNLERRIWDHDP